MAEELRIGLSELLREAMIEYDADFLKEGVCAVLSQALMELEVEASHLPAILALYVGKRRGQIATDTLPDLRTAKAMRQASVEFIQHLRISLEDSRPRC